MASSQYEKDKQARKAKTEVLRAKHDDTTIKSDLNDNTIAMTTFKQKFENFWYHYKVHVIVGILLVAMGTHLFISIFFKPKFDATLNIISSSSFEGSSIFFLEHIEEILPDYDKDGRVTMEVNPIQVGGGEQSPLAGDALSAQQAKFFATTSDNKLFLYLLDDTGYKSAVDIGMSFKDLSEFNSPNIKGDKYYLNETKLSELFSLDDTLNDMYLCIVDFEKYTSKSNSSQKIYDRNYDFLKRMIEYN